MRNPILAQGGASSTSAESATQCAVPMVEAQRIAAGKMGLRVSGSLNSVAHIRAGVILAFAKHFAVKLAKRDKMLHRFPPTNRTGCVLVYPLQCRRQRGIRVSFEQIQNAPTQSMRTAIVGPEVCQCARDQPRVGRQQRGRPVPATGINFGFGDNAAP